MIRRLFSTRSRPRRCVRTSSTHAPYDAAVRRNDPRKRFRYRRALQPSHALPSSSPAVRRIEHTPGDLATTFTLQRFEGEDA